MKKLINLLLAGFVLFSLSVSCSSEEEGEDRNREERISAMFNGADNAFAMFSIDVGNIIEKSGVNDGVLPIQFQFLMDQVLQYIKDEKMTGIDMDAKVHVFVDTDGADEPEYFIANIMLKDQSAFQAFVEKELDFKMISEEKAETPVAQSRDKQMLATWNEKGYAILVNANSRKAAENGKKYLEKLWENQTKADLDKDILAYLKNDADISFFAKGNKTADFVEIQANNQKDQEVHDLMEKMQEYTKGSHSAAYITFNNGNITVKNEIKWNDKFIQEYPYLRKGGVDPEIMNYLSKDGKAIGIGNVSLNMDALWSFFDFVAPAELKTEMDKEMKSAGVALEMLKSAVSGDIAVALNGFNFPMDEEGAYDQSNDKVYFSLAMSTKNSALIDEVMSQSPDLQGGDRFYYVKGINYIITDKFLVVTSDAELANNIKEGKTVPVNMGAMNEASTASEINGVFDFKLLNESLKGLPGTDEVSQVTDLFDHITFNADMNGSEFILYFKEKNQNALRVVTASASEGLTQFM